MGEEYLYVKVIESLRIVQVKQLGDRPVGIRNSGAQKAV